MSLRFHEPPRHATKGSLSRRMTTMSDPSKPSASSIGDMFGAAATPTFLGLPEATISDGARAAIAVLGAPAATPYKSVGAYCARGTEFSFVGCTVSPGFEFEDFEMAKRSELLARYPQCREAIERLTD